MQYKEWAQRVKEEKAKEEAMKTTIVAKTIGEFDMEHRIENIPTTVELGQFQDKITALMHTLEQISISNNGNTPRLGLYGDMSWDLVNMETDEWLIGGDNVYTDIDHIISSYQGFSDIEQKLRNAQIEKVKFNRVANQLHRKNELHIKKVDNA